MSVENTISKKQFEDWFAFYLDGLVKGIKTSDGTYIRSPLETDILPKEIKVLLN